MTEGDVRIAKHRRPPTIELVRGRIPVRVSRTSVHLVPSEKCPGKRGENPMKPHHVPVEGQVRALADRLNESQSGARISQAGANNGRANKIKQE